MEHGFRKKLWLTYLVSLSLGIGLAWMIYQQNLLVSGTTMNLVQQDMAALERLSDLKLAIVSAQNSLFENYAAHRVQVDYPLDTDISPRLRLIRGKFSNSRQLFEIENNYNLIKELASQLEQTLAKTPVDWDQARTLLGATRQASSEINSDIELISGSIRNSIARQQAQLRTGVETANRTLLLLAALMFFLSAFVGYYVNSYLRGALQRRKLAMYPERNPYPVIGLSNSGDMLYSNPAARQMMKALGAASVLELLPPELPQKLAELKNPAQHDGKWEYPLADRIFSCRIHFSPDLEAFHAYISDITSRKQAEHNLMYLAYHDPLTGLPNRRGFQEALELAICQPETDLAVIMLLNLDRFRLITESLGHLVGDQLLSSIAERFSRTLQCHEMSNSHGTLYRLEGDLFAVLLPNVETLDFPNLLATRFAACMKTPLPHEGREFFFTLSIGAAVFPRDGMDTVTLVKNAESAAHQVRNLGGNGIRCYDLEMNARALERLELENSLRNAENRAEFELHYQPQLHIATGEIHGAEALIRWNHPVHGLVPPDEFIPLAEENGLILPIGEWVLRTACTQCKNWLAAGFPPFKVAVNISARQFLGGDLPKLVRQILNDTGLPARHLELEVTESVAMHDVDSTVSILKELKQIGISLSIDDFGTGYSSLNYLKRFPIDKLKIDRSFVSDMTQDPALVRAIVALGKSLKLDVIAEGVENYNDLSLLAGFSCDEAQGYLISRPLKATDFSSFASSRKDFWSTSILFQANCPAANPEDHAH